MFGHKRKNQAAMYLCNNWIQYERSFDTLQPEEVLNAKYLFSGLQKLTQDERLYLASQYRTARGRRYTDQEIADIKGVPMEEHRAARIDILTKLQYALMEVDEALKEEPQQNMQ